MLPRPQRRPLERAGPEGPTFRLPPGRKERSSRRELRQVGPKIVEAAKAREAALTQQVELRKQQTEQAHSALAEAMGKRLEQLDAQQKEETRNQRAKQ